MTTPLRIVILLVALLNMFLVVKDIRKGKIQIEYSVFWVIFSFLLVVLGIFPQICYWAAGLLGIQSPANFVFAFMLIVLLLRNFTLSKEVSQLNVKVTELAQSITLSEKEK
jgi:hypothetical protein